MRIAVLGAGGGLGRNVVDAARAVKHNVVALVRDPKRAELPDDVTTVVGDATRVDDVVRAVAGADATMFCVNPRLATWLTTFQPLLECAIAAARQTNTRLMFPANVWIYGPGRAGELVAESRSSSPTSRRGELRAAMERQIRAAGIRYAIVRLPEFYGPSVNSLTTRVFRSALGDRRALWPGPIDVAIELVYMPDAARALVEVAIAADCDAAVFNLPGAQTTPRQFVELVYRAAGRKPRVSAVPLALVRRERVRCELAWRDRHQPCVVAADPAQRHEVHHALRRDTPDAARRRDRDNVSVASRASPAATKCLTSSRHSGIRSPEECFTCPHRAFKPPRSDLTRCRTGWWRCPPSRRWSTRRASLLRRRSRPGSISSATASSIGSTSIIPRPTA